MTLTGFDVSHYQGSVNFGAAAGSGRSFVVVKATEGTGYLDPMFTTNRAAAHSAGLAVGMYHFANGGDIAAEAQAFLSAVGALQQGEFLVLDWETAFPGDHVGWCKQWLDTVAAATGVNPLIYMNQSEMRGHDWTPISGTYGLWLAQYDGSQAQPAVASWAGAAMKQYSSAGSVPGVAGGCDVNVFYGDANALAAYGKGATDMPLTAADVQAVAAAVLDTGVTRKGGAQTGNTTLREVLAWSDSHIDTLMSAVGKPPVIDPAALAQAIVAALPAAQAQQVVNELGKRLNTPAV